MNVYANALEASLDRLPGGSDKTNFDKQALKFIDKIEEIHPSVKEQLYFLANAITSDAKTVNVNILVINHIPHSRNGNVLGSQNLHH